jgi:hypothetical protein
MVEMDVVDTLRFIAGTLTTAMALGAGIGVVLAIFLGLPNEMVARCGYTGTAFGFVAGVLFASSILASGLIG